MTRWRHGNHCHTHRTREMMVMFAVFLAVMMILMMRFRGRVHFYIMPGMYFAVIVDDHRGDSSAPHRVKRET